MELGNAYALGAALLLEGPTIQNVAALNAALGREVPAGQAAMEDFHNRTVVSCAPTFVPLTEEAVRNAYQKDGAWVFSSWEGKFSRQVAAVYRACGFDYRNLQGDQFVMGSLRPDALGVECAFMAFLLCGSPDDEPMDQARRFRDRHLAKWAAKAEEVCLARGSDWYAAAVGYVATLVDADEGLAGE